MSDPAKISPEVPATPESHEAHLIQQADVPQSVMQALQRWLANFRPTKMERSERPVLGGNGATYLIYEFEGQHGGMEVDIEVSADGSRVVVVDNSRG